MATPVTYDGITFPSGTVSFADSVELYDTSFGGGNEPTQDTDPTASLGTPEDPDYVSLGAGGRLIVEFTDNVLTGSGDSTADLHIFEIGPDVEDTFIDISADGNTWFSVGKVDGSTDSIDIDTFLDNSPFTQFTTWRFVRITDDINEGNTDGATVGADIDAVGAIGNKFLTEGGDGDDVLDGSDESDNVVGGAGNDTVSGQDGDDILELGDGDDIGRGNADDDVMIGGVGLDHVYGNQNDDQVYGNQGDDLVFGGLDQDLVFGGQAVDQVYGNLGDDQVYGNLDDDLLFGGQDNDALFGGQANDRLFGNKGSDQIYGNAGNDELHGGGADDDFYFGNESGGDVVVDFSEGDTISIRANVNGGSVTSFSQLTITPNSDGDAEVDLGDDNSITIQGIGPDELSEADFSFF